MDGNCLNWPEMVKSRPPRWSMVAGVAVSRRHLHYASCGRSRATGGCHQPGAKLSCKDATGTERRPLDDVRSAVVASLGQEEGRKVWQLDERTRIHGPSDFDPRAGEREWRILRIQPCRFTGCILREHWEWVPGWYNTEAEALANAREFLSGEPWPRQSNEEAVRIDVALVEGRGSPKEPQSRQSRYQRRRDNPPMQSLPTFAEAIPPSTEYPTPPSHTGCGRGCRRCRNERKC